MERSKAEVNTAVDLEPLTAEESPRRKTPPPNSAWPAGVACACFCGLSLLLLQAYGLLHWRILNDHYASLEGTLRAHLFRLLLFLEVYHLTALLSVVFGIWAFRGEPHWIRWACLPLILISFVTFILVM